jgi:hypothetical protein
MTSRGGALDLIDDATDAVPRLGTWVGFLWITALPPRLLLVMFLLRAHSLGGDAREYGTFLRQIAYAALAAWIVSLYGRLVFVRACQESLQSERTPDARVLRVPLSQFASYITVAVWIEALFWLFFVTLGAPIVLLLPAGLAPAAIEPGGTPLDAAKATLRAMGRPFRLVRLGSIFAIAAALAFLNLHVLASAALWVAGGFPGAHLERFAPMMHLGQPLYRLLLLAAVSLLVEPFWLAALAAHVGSLRAVNSGEDLRRWFEELRQA